MSIRRRPLLTPLPKDGSGFRAGGPFSSPAHTVQSCTSRYPQALGTEQKRDSEGMEKPPRPGPAEHAVGQLRIISCQVKGRAPPGKSPVRCHCRAHADSLALSLFKKAVSVARQPEELEEEESEEMGQKRSAKLRQSEPWQSRGISLLASQGRLL